jgi:hypothetical protein
VPEAQSAFVVQAAASTQLSPCGGCEAESAMLRWPIQIG